MKGIDCTFISDLYGYQPELPGGDLLVIAGDLTARDKAEQYKDFVHWLDKQAYDKIVIVAGNHDCLLQEPNHNLLGKHEYLQDSGIEYEGVNIWGTPWTSRFYGQNPECAAFSYRSEFQLKDHFEIIPFDTDILVCHSPAKRILDQCSNGRVGSSALREQLFRVNPQVFVCGHIHECGGTIEKYGDVTCINASVVNERYKLVNKPITLRIHGRQDVKRSMY